MPRALTLARPARPWAQLALSALLSACTTVGRDYEPPAAELPPAWRAEPEAGFQEGAAELAAWWRELRDPQLAGFVERAIGEGLDLRAALARVRQARALRGSAAAERTPTVDGTASYQRRSESENTPIGAFAPDNDQVAVGLDASWEVDLWGRVRRSVEAADADLEASLEDARDVAVTVAAETARAYVDLRAFQSRLAIARQNVALQEETRELVRGRFEAGLVGERDVAQASINLETTRSRVPALEVGLRAAENRLAVLTGRAPGAFAEELAEARPIPRPPERIATGVPADLLRRRPDVRAAERRLAAEVARIGVAEGELYPRLTLAGTLGYAADDSSELLESRSGLFGFGPSLRWSLFDGGRLRELVRAQDARAEEAALAWERAVLDALEEAENARTAFAREQVRRDFLAAATGEARRAVEFARTQYGEGLTDFLAVLDSERALADLEDQLSASDAAVTTGLVALYQALGGGFEHEPFASAVARVEP